MTRWMLFALLLLGLGGQGWGASLVPALGGRKFEKPVFLTYADDGSGRMYVVEQDGQVVSVTPDGTVTPFLDIRDRVRRDDLEEGLLCLAFHPHYSDNHFFYVIYSLKGVQPRRTRLSRFQTMPGDSLHADPNSEKVILEIPKRHGNHNGSTLLFGRDGFLYISLGDGGGAGDEDGNAQNLGSLLGKILRLDVDRPSGDTAYRPAAGNPFIGKDGARPEIWAYGLRNPWRMSFDRATGQLWVGDVGQDRWEEVDRITRGGNYGWNLREGKHDFAGHAGLGLIEPILDYGREDGFCVTGGYVYRGSAIKSLYGDYVFGDYGSRRIWAMDRHTGLKHEIARSSQPIPSFGEGPAGELYVLGYQGSIFKLLP